MSDGQDKAPIVEEGVLVAGGITKDRAKARLECALADLAKRKVVNEVQKGLRASMSTVWSGRVFCGI